MKPATRLVLSTDTVYEYSICGLKLISNVPFVLPNAQASDNRGADIRFTLKSGSNPTENRLSNKINLGNIKNGAGHPSITVYRADQLHILDCHNTSKKMHFVMSRTEGWIDCYPQAEATNYDVEVWLFGLVLAFFLQDRGIFTLHAAAVNCEGRAIAFLGHNGYGKSTLASYFLRRGHSLVTDDVLPLVKRDRYVVAMPVCPAMNLWPQTLAQLRNHHLANSTKQMMIRKRRYSLETLGLRFSRTGTPLAAIYFLSPTNSPAQHPTRITPIPKARALIELLHNTRANSMIEVHNQKQLFKTYADLVSRIPICQLEYSRGFDVLPAVYDAILNNNVRHGTCA
jgi:hypothetical protein